MPVLPMRPNKHGSEPGHGQALVTLRGGLPHQTSVADKPHQRPMAGRRIQKSNAEVTVQRGRRGGQIGGGPGHDYQPLFQHDHPVHMGQHGPVVSVDND